MRWFWMFLGLCTGLVAVASLTLWAFEGFDTWNLSLEGVIALVVGSALTALLAIGLMALVFHSHRSGHDEAAAHDDPFAGPPR
jgi:hypothetical protein